MASGARPSCARKPCELAAKRLRRVPVSNTSTRLRARASCRAAERPAKLPPTTATSNIMGYLVQMTAARNEPPVEISRQRRQRDAAQALEQHRLGTAVGVFERRVHRLLDQAAGAF